MKVAHLTTADISLRLLLFAQLCAVRDAGGEAVGISAPGPVRRGARTVRGSATSRSIPRPAPPIPSPTCAPRASCTGSCGASASTCCTPTTPSPGVYGRVVGRLARVPVIVNTVHGLYATEDDRVAARAVVYGLEAFAARFSDAELVQNPEDLALLQRLHLTKHARLLGNGVDLTRFDRARFSAEARRAARAALGACDDTIVVGTVGRLVAEKGYPELFEAMAALDPSALPARGRRVRGSRQGRRAPAGDRSTRHGARGRRVRRPPRRHRDAVLGDGRVRPRLAPRGLPARGDGSGGDVAAGRDHRRAGMPPGRRGRTQRARRGGARRRRARPGHLDPRWRSGPARPAWVPRPGQRALAEFDEERVVARVLDTYREVANTQGCGADHDSRSGVPDVRDVPTPRACPCCTSWSGDG